MLLKEKIQSFLIMKGYLDKSEKGTVWGNEEQRAWAQFCDTTPGFGRYATKSPSYENVAADKVAYIEQELKKAEAKKAKKAKKDKKAESKESTESVQDLETKTEEQEPVQVSEIAAETKKAKKLSFIKSILE